MSVRIAIVAGETSGDVLGAGLIRALKARNPDMQFEGIGGPRMQSTGCESFFPMESLTVIGFDGLRRIPEILRIRRTLCQRWCSNPPDLFIGIDVPDFNLSLEKRLKKCGIPIVHYVSPTIWAWRPRRIGQIQRVVDHMLALFPFERRYYDEHNIPVTVVGHPLADVIPEEYDRAKVQDELGLPRDKRIVALLPGSRSSELRHHGQLFAETARWLAAKHDDLFFVASFANTETREIFAQSVARLQPPAPAITVLMHRARHLMAASDVVLAASGTVTLEAALLKKPMVVTYRVSWLTAAIVRAFLHVKYLSLPNNLAGREVVPELLQEDATPEKLGAAVERYLSDEVRRQQTADALGEIYRTLRQNANERAATAVMAMLEKKRGNHSVAVVT